MKTITKTINVYEFSELSDKAKQKAIYDFYQDVDFAWVDENNDTLKRFCDVFDCRIKRDGLQLRKDNTVSDMSGIRLLKYLHNNYYNDLFKPKYLGHVKNKAKYSKCQRDTSCVLTGYYMDEDMLQPIYDFMKKSDENTTFQDLIDRCLDAFNRAVEQDAEYQQSEEYFEDMCEANGYTFDVNGKMINL